MKNLRKILRKLVIIGVLLIIVVFLLNFSTIKTEIYKKVYKLNYAEYVEKYSSEYNVDKYLIFATIKAESNFNEQAISNKDAKGLMQLMYTTAEEIAQKIDVKIDENSVLDPEININLGTKYLSMLIKKYDNIGLALAAYNAGSGNVDNWIASGVLKEDGSNMENIPYLETNNYVRKILRDYNIYQDLYGKRDGSEFQIGIRNRPSFQS